MNNSPIFVQIDRLILNIDEIDYIQSKNLTLIVMKSGNVVESRIHGDDIYNAIEEKLKGENK